MQLTFVDKVIEKINSYYKNHISTILGVNIDSNINGYKILAIICKKIA